MVEQWRPNVAYGPAGEKVEYEGTVYELIQPHTSQMGWEPTQTPALWRVSRKSSSSSGDHHSSSHHSSSHHSSSNNQSSSNQSSSNQSSSNQSSSNQQQQQQAPVINPFQGQQNIVDQQQQQQQQQNPIPYQWSAYTGSMPQNAISLSNSLGKTFGVARGGVEGGIHPGYFDPRNNKCFTSYGGKEVICEKFEVLTCDPTRYYWVRCTDPKNINGNPVIGGNESNGTPLYVAKCVRNGVPYFGKTSAAANCAYFGLDQKEQKINEFEVLCYK